MLDAAWPAGMVLVGAAAWQTPRKLDSRALNDRGFLPVPIAAGLCATGLLLAAHTAPGRSTRTEWSAFMRRHTLVGERILAAAPALLDVAKLVRSSHERYDGEGYPDGLAGEAIPLGARVIGVCDAWDAMTTDRPYRRAMSREDALAELERCAREQFDPTVVEVFRAVLTKPKRHLQALA